VKGRDGGGNLINVKYKPLWNCHNEFPLYNKYILIKNKNKSGILFHLAKGKITKDSR
jgi:hypothetical protein